MENRKTPSGLNWALGDDDVALGETQAAPPSDGARAVGSSNPASVDPLLGSVLADKYKILEVVGEGGMGRVYRAEHTVTGGEVAVKVLSGRFGSTPQKAILDRFFREVRTTAALNHPGIVRLYDAGEENGMAYLVMEFLAGEDLGHLLKREGPLSPTRAVAIMLQLCEALEAAHEARDREGRPLDIVHRDLKPENIFLVEHSGGQRDFVKVVDFGIAKVRLEIGGRLTLDGQAIGTPEFMSPEQARGQVADRRSDVYAAGALLYLMLTGHLPHEAAVGPNATPVKVLHIKGENTDPTPVTEYCKDLPPALARAVMHALENSAAERPQTMAEFANELRAAMAAPSRGTTTAKTAVQVRKPFPTFWVGVAAVALVAIGVGVIAAQRGDEPAPNSLLRSGKLQSDKPETATVPAVAQPVQPVTTPPPAVEDPVPDVPAPTPSVTSVPAIQRGLSSSARGEDEGGVGEGDAQTPPKVQSTSRQRTSSRTVEPRSAEAGAEHVTRAQKARRRDNGRKARIAALRQQVVDIKVALRRNPRNRALRARLNGACRELTELGETIPECQ